VGSFERSERGEKLGEVAEGCSRQARHLLFSYETSRVLGLFGRGFSRWKLSGSSSALIGQSGLVCGFVIDDVFSSLWGRGEEKAFFAKRDLGVADLIEIGFREERVDACVAFRFQDRGRNDEMKGSWDGGRTVKWLRVREIGEIENIFKVCEREK